MRIRILSLFTMFMFTAAVWGQNPTAVKPSVATGDVLTASSDKIVLQTPAGMLLVPISDKTEFKRVPPDNPVLKAAVAATAADIGAGDKVLVTGIMSEDKKTLPARTVYLMTKADIAQKQAKDAAEWTTRGISGRVQSVDAATGEISVEVRGLTGSTTVVVKPKGDAVFRRYAPNSVKFSEAKIGTIADVQQGDMLRALGDKSADGAGFAAEEVLTGAFRTTAGAVKSIDIAKNEIVITDAQAKTDITVELGSVSTMKKFPEEMAARLAAAQGGMPGGQMGGRPGGQAGGQRPGGPGGARSGGIDDMLDRFPNITAADLKVGEVIAVSSTKTDSTDRISAIKLLSGIEPFLRAAQARTGGGRRGSSTTQSLEIPGLDGIEF